MKTTSNAIVADLKISKLKYFSNHLKDLPQIFNAKGTKCIATAWGATEERTVVQSDRTVFT